jgi:hypothetical protein
MVDWHSIENRAQRDAHFKSYDLHAQLLIFSAGIGIGIPSDCLGTSGGIREQVLLRLEAAGDGNIQHAHFVGTHTPEQQHFDLVAASLRVQQTTPDSHPDL